MDALKRLWKRYGVAFDEPSTWRGVIALLAALGLTIDPEMENAIIVFGLALSGLLDILFKTESNPDPEVTAPKKNTLDLIKATRERDQS